MEAERACRLRSGTKQPQDCAGRSARPQITPLTGAASVPPVSRAGAAADFILPCNPRRLEVSVVAVGNLTWLAPLLRLNRTSDARASAHTHGRTSRARAAGKTGGRFRLWLAQTPSRGTGIRLSLPLHPATPTGSRRTAVEHSRAGKAVSRWGRPQRWCGQGGSSPVRGEPPPSWPGKKPRAVRI